MLVRLAFAVSVLFAAATGVNAQQTVTADPNTIAEIIKDEGFRAGIKSDSSGNPRITSTSQGVRFSIYFYGCENGRNCDSIQFQAGFDFNDPQPADVVLRWNREKRFTRAVLTDNGDPIIRLDVNLDGGVTRANFQDTFDIWTILLGQFRDHIGWRR